MKYYERTWAENHVDKMVTMKISRNKDSYNFSEESSLLGCGTV
jgi:hypothetical protein